ncbi:DUF427 domain-containing protein [Altererythrobacter sp. ZODW24]|uniref:DUF427 domain-containing protein n=1 Tax=Altererythrobacter sp. ZODW24 TaxID=2185142 RepID=UPI000DF75EF9|nr:DUF427 domain-containing protein [Altererythrobacter sp. ZODW24]
MAIEASWNGEVLALSETTVMVEGNHYFPIGAVNDEFLADSETTSFCPWKGTASYYSIEAGGEHNKDAAFIYRDPKEKAEHIREHIAFWKGVEIREV